MFYRKSIFWANLSFFLVLIILIPLFAQEHPKQLTILFTGDTGGRIKEDNNGWGGLAKRAFLINQIRKEKE